MMHWLEIDSRFQSLEQLFKSIDSIIDDYKENCPIELYWDETIILYGIILISLQNYINLSCSDLKELDICKNKKNYEFYKEESKIINNGITEVELLVHLSNYFKHRDDNDNLKEPLLSDLINVKLLTKETANKLFRKDNRFEDEVIINGISKIIPLNQPILNLLIIVKKWRDDLWEKYKS